MPEIFDEFDLELEKVDMDIALFEADGGDSIAICGGGSGGGGGGGSDDPTLTTAPTCFNVCA